MSNEEGDQKFGQRIAVGGSDIVSHSHLRFAESSYCLSVSLRSCSLLLDGRLPIHIIKLVLGQSQSLACLVRSSVDAIRCRRETETEFPEMHSTLVD